MTKILGKVPPFIILVLVTNISFAFQSLDLTFDSLPDVLPGTSRISGDISEEALSNQMMSRAHVFIERKISEALSNRKSQWNRNLSSRAAFEKSIQPNIARFSKSIGLEDSTNRYADYHIGFKEVLPKVTMQKYADVGESDIIAETALYQIFQVRWPSLPGVLGEGLLLRPKGAIRANVIAIPDAGQTPEDLVGLTNNIEVKSQFARHLAENGIQVLVPLLISREEIDFGSNQQTYREWIYRQAFQMGRHIIGFEVQKVRAAIDWFKIVDPDLAVGVAGYCEGGLIAYYSAAVDQRIDVVMTSGYFDNRDSLWNEPIYRNVFGFLDEFGDAEIAAMIAPRPLVVEYSHLPSDLISSTQKPEVLSESGSGYKGTLKTPDFISVKNEFDRIGELVSGDFQQRKLIYGENGSPLEFGSEKALLEFARFLAIDQLNPLTNTIPEDQRSNFDAQVRQVRQVKELEKHVQKLMHLSDQERNRFFLHKVMPEFADRTWSTRSYHHYLPPGNFIDESKNYRQYFWEEILGKFSQPYIDANARTKKVYDKELWTGYEVVLDVYRDLIAPGVLLIPKDIQYGEKRPVVVVQHGRGGVPKIVIEGNTSYYNIAAKLADQGFIVYATYGLFRGEDRYRWLDRKANAIGKTLFSLIVSQHEQHLNWLSSLSFVDKDRIAFYGKSYGGETAMRVPAVLEGYCLSICSADFGDWTRKVVDVYSHRSFMQTVEWEMPYFNMGTTFSYAELAYLIFPRPFMVERGRHDRVQPDEWVASEFAKVQHLYDRFNLLDRTQIEFFNGGHASRNNQTFDFLHKFLSWP